MEVFFNRFSIVLYFLMFIIYAVNYEPFLLEKMGVISVFILLYAIRNKYTWYILIILIFINILVFFLPCNYPISFSIYAYLCAYRTFDLYSYFSMYIPIGITTNYYKLFYFVYLCLAIIIINLKTYKKLYFDK